MDRHSNSIVEKDLTNTAFAYTPQQVFENADQMLLQANAIAECAEQLHAQAEAMLNEARAVRNAAFELQGKGMDERKEISQALEVLCELHNCVLTKFDAEKPGARSKLALAVEDGSAHMKDVEKFGDELSALSESTGSDGVLPQAESIQELQDKHNIAIVASNIAEVTEPKPTQQVAHTNTFQHRPGAHNSAIIEHSDDEYFSAAANPDIDRLVVHPITSPTSEEEEQLSTSKIQVQKSGGLASVPNKKKRHKGRVDRKMKLLRDAGFNDEEISQINLTTVNTPPRKRRRMGRLLQNA